MYVSLILGLIAGGLFALVILVDTIWQAIPLDRVNKVKLCREMLGAFLVGLTLVFIFS